MSIRLLRILTLIFVSFLLLSCNYLIDDGRKTVLKSEFVNENEETLSRVLVSVYDQSSMRKVCQIESESANLSFPDSLDGIYDIEIRSEDSKSMSYQKDVKIRNRQIEGVFDRNLFPSMKVTGKFKVEGSVDSVVIQIVGYPYRVVLEEDSSYSFDFLPEIDFEFEAIIYNDVSVEKQEIVDDVEVIEQGVNSDDLIKFNDSTLIKVSALSAVDEVVYGFDNSVSIVSNISNGITYEHFYAHSYIVKLEDKYKLEGFEVSFKVKLNSLNPVNNLAVKVLGADTLPIVESFFRTMNNQIEARSGFREDWPINSEPPHQKLLMAFTFDQWYDVKICFNSDSTWSISVDDELLMDNYPIDLVSSNEVSYIGLTSSMFDIKFKHLAVSGNEI